MKFWPVIIVLTSSLIADAVELTGVELDELNDDSFSVRAAAHKSLNDWCDNHPEKAISFLYSAYEVAKNPESKARLLSLLEERVLLVEYGKPKGFVGIHMENKAATLNGVAIDAVWVGIVQPGSPADKFGLKAGDAITSVDGKGFSANVLASTQFKDLVASKNAGDKVSLEWLRNEELLSVELTLGAMPEALERDYNRRLGISPKQQKQKYFDEWLRKRELNSGS